MTLEAVIGQDAAQVGIVGEIDAEQIPRLALPPAGAAEEPDRRRHRLLLVGLDLEANALVESHAEEIVDDLEAQRPVGIVDAANVAEHGEAAFRVVAQKLQDPGQGFALDPTAQFAGANLGGDQRIGQRRREMLGEGLEFFVHRAAQRAKLRVRLIFFCSSSTP